MSDLVEETPGDFSFPGPTFSGEQVTIRVGSFNYLFERTPQDTLIYVSRSPVAIVEDDEDDKPFDPSEYR